MLRTTFTSLWFHRRRFVATALAVILGVGFLTGTRMLNDTIDGAFQRLWRTTSVSADAVIRGPALYTTNQGRTQYGTIPDQAVAATRAVTGVDGVNPRRNTTDVTLVGRDGRAVKGPGGGYVRSWPTDARFALSEVVDGRAPTATGEVILDEEVAGRAGYRVGDDATVLTPAGRVGLRVVGISRRAADNDMRGPGSIGVTLPQAESLAGQPGQLDAIDVIAAPGVSSEELVRRLRAADVAPGATVVTATELEAETAARFGQQVELFTQLLLLFSAVALFVTAFIIANTFGILVAQRTRELALLRAVGAGRTQVLMSVLAEAAVVGMGAAAVGVVAGIGLAWGALKGLGALGLRLPDVGLIVRPAHGVEAIVVGLVVALAAALGPAIRATRVPPIAALRAAAVDTSGGSRWRTAGGLVLAAVGVVLFRPAFGPTPSLDTMPRIGIGLAVTLIAVLVLGPVVIRPLVGVLGLPLGRRGGVAGRLARRNARRSPRRTASTVAALTIGVALVGFITVLAASARASVAQSLAGGFRGDFLVQPVSGRGAFGADPALARHLAEVDGVAATTSIGGTTGQLTLPDGTKIATAVAGIDPASYDRLFTTPVTAGRLRDLGVDGLAVTRLVADEQGVRLGDRVDIVSVRSRSARFVVRAIVDTQALLPDWTTTTAGLERLTGRRTDLLVAVAAEPGRAAAIRPALETVVADYPTMTLQDRDQYTAEAADDIGTVLNLLYALLAMSVVIAFIGITNTLSLSVHERGRELGVLRAVGMSRRQLRATIRWEAVLVSVLGTGLGLAAGLGIAYTLVRALAGRGLTTFAVPVTALVVLVVGGAVLGVVAAARPAARAARVNIVAAIGEG